MFNCHIISSEDGLDTINATIVIDMIRTINRHINRFFDIPGFEVLLV